MSEKYHEALVELRMLSNEIRGSAQDSTYGFFHGGDPRNFSPDPEASDDEEQARHAAACAEWEATGNNPNPAPHCTMGGLQKAPPGFGLGVNTYIDEDALDWAERIDRCIDRLADE